MKESLQEAAALGLVLTSLKPLPNHWEMWLRAAASVEKVTYLQSTFAAFRFLTFKKEILNWRGDRRGVLMQPGLNWFSKWVPGNWLEIHVFRPTHLLSGHLRGGAGTF